MCVLAHQIRMRHRGTVGQPEVTGANKLRVDTSLHPFLVTNTIMHTPNAQGKNEVRWNSHDSVSFLSKLYSFEHNGYSSISCAPWMFPSKAHVWLKHASPSQPTRSNVYIRYNSIILYIYVCVCACVFTGAQPGLCPGVPGGCLTFLPTKSR